MKRVNIEIEIEGEILATSELEARKAVSQELLSEIPWAITHSTDIEVLHPIFFNTLDVWYSMVEDKKQDFYDESTLSGELREENPKLWNKITKEIGNYMAMLDILETVMASLAFKEGK